MSNFASLNTYNLNVCVLSGSNILIQEFYKSSNILDYEFKYSGSGKTSARHS